MRDLFISYDSQSVGFPFLHPAKKGFSIPLSLAKKRIYLDTQLKGEFIDLF